MVGDVRNPDADRPPEPHIYLPVSQSMRDSMAVIARTTGDRMALGARVSDVMATVMHRGVTPVLFGLTIGVLGAFAISRAMGSMLYGISPHDPLTFIGTPLMLVVVALVASLIPALRAARIDPIITLRYE